MTKTVISLALDEIRNEWEKGLTEECLIRQNTKGNVLVLLTQDLPSRAKTVYHCHRYFPIGDVWNVSVDKQRVDLNEVWPWLADNCGD